MELKQSEVLLGCWGLGGARYGRVDNRVLSHGPFAGKTFPLATAPQHGPDFPNWRLPPLARSTPDGIDLMPFLLYDSIRMDHVAFDCVIGRQHALKGWHPNKENIVILESLASDGLIRLENYEENLNHPETQTLLDVMIELDLSDPCLLTPAQKSLQLWIEFQKDLFGRTGIQLDGLREVQHNLNNGKPDDAACDYLYECVADVNRLLLLSQVLDKPIYDWEDYGEFYKYKFLRAGKLASSSRGQTLHRLFTLFVPNFRIRTYSELLDIKHDQRLSSVRSLVEDLNDREPNDEIVLTAYEDVLRMKIRTETFSRYIGYAGFALGFLPNVFSSALQLAAGSIFEKWLRRGFQWQTFFVERAIQYKKSDVVANLHVLSHEIRGER